VAAWLDSDEPRFVLILGDFGTGKTFLLQKLAYDLRDHHQLAPALVRMRDLQKSRTLDELVAQHMASREDPFHLRSFRYLLRLGQITLLFDGFDKLALRTDYDWVVAHFETLREAAGGAAKVAVTSRHQYFATDHAVRKALGTRVEALPGSRIIRLLRLSEAQRRQLVVLAFDSALATHLFAAIERASGVPLTLVDALHDLPADDTLLHQRERLDAWLAQRPDRKDTELSDLHPSST
jgi:NACHT domain-containing protein